MRNGTVGQGSNSAFVRQFNERVILTLLRRLGEASKADLARHAKLTQNTAGQIVRELEEQNLVRTEGKRTGMDVVLAIVTSPRQSKTCGNPAPRRSGDPEPITRRQLAGGTFRLN